MNKTDPEELIKFGLHLGHRAKKINPKARKYIYKIEKGACIIDLFQTAESIDAAREFVYSLGQKNLNLLFVSTKRVASNLVSDICRNASVNFLTAKWPAGFLTNFEQISKNIKKLSDLKKEKEEGLWNKHTKHEQSILEKKLAKLSKIYSGVENIEKIPEALFIVDTKNESTALAEAKRSNIKTIAIVDTNSDPSLVDFPIPANDDLAESISCITQKIIDSYIEGKQKKSNV